MADSVEDVRKEFERQIADLKKELRVLSRSARERGEELYGEAYDGIAGQARNAVRQIREQAQVAGGAIRENPGTAATVLSSAGILGFLIGLVVGQALNSRR